MSGLKFDAARLKERFRLGDLTSVDLKEAPLKPGRWEMEIHSRADGVVQVETQRGEVRHFASLDAARTYAESIGFKKMQIWW